jgi:hypothetical protein
MSLSEGGRAVTATREEEAGGRRVGQGGAGTGGRGRRQVQRRQLDHERVQQQTRADAAVVAANDIAVGQTRSRGATAGDVFTSPSSSSLPPPS